MKRLARILVSGLTAVPFTVLAVTSAAPAAHAEDNGVGLTPLMGFSTWNVPGRDPTAANVEAAALALKTSGLLAAGYNYVNVDDFWYDCPGSQGPDVDAYGHWVTNASEFPPSGSTNGIEVVANYVHHLGEKFGIYVTPGISDQAVAENTTIEGTPYTADEIADGASENNYNCGGMQGINYDAPGAQAFINSWADEFASWGVDYVKVDGVGSFDIPDVQAWSNALRQTGRPIHLELSNSLNIADASTWQEYSNGWRTGGDIQCYCGSPYPLTTWSSVATRFDQVAEWAPYGSPGAFNDYDSLTIGSGPAVEGLSFTEEQSMMSLWALAASPLVINADMTDLDRANLNLLENHAVISVDQDAIDATRFVDTSTQQVFAKTEKSGGAVAGLFNTSGSPEVISVPAATLGLPASNAYLLNNLWTHQLTETAGVISANVPSHGVALLRISALRDPATVPPSGTLNVTLPATLTGGQPDAASLSFSDNGVRPALRVRLGLHLPKGWTATPTTPTSFRSVASGATVQTTFHVVAPQPSGLFTTSTVSAVARYTWPGRTPQNLRVQQQVTTSPPVQAPYLTYSSATDAPAAFGQSGQTFGISGAGTDLYSDADAYSTIYQNGVVGNTAAIETEVTSQQDMTGYAKAGIIVRNDMTGSGSTPEGVILFESPSGGIQLEWDSDSGDYINSVTPPNGTNPELLPVWLELVRNGSTYTGYYTFDGTDWQEVGSATVPAQAATQDAGMFVTSHATGEPGQAVFNGFSASASATTPSIATVYQAASPANTLAGGAVAAICPTCYGGEKVGYVGEGGTLTYNNVSVPTSGTYNVIIIYCDGSATGRQADITVDGGRPQLLSFTPTGSFDTVGAMTVTAALTAGNNTIELSNPAAYAPDMNEIIVSSSPS
jgi:Alpha galactosidase A/NPCBM-associated, NEW3 domain of alpha-galactosidase/Alpha galactosidase C-terminal beta sandwich domain/Carbohydrate binding module (family 35)